MVTHAFIQTVKSFELCIPRARNIHNNIIMLVPALLKSDADQLLSLLIKVTLLMKNDDSTLFKSYLLDLLIVELIVFGNDKLSSSACISIRTSCGHTEFYQLNYTTV